MREMVDLAVQTKNKEKASVNRFDYGSLFVYFAEISHGYLWIATIYFIFILWYHYRADIMFCKEL